MKNVLVRESREDKKFKSKLFYSLLLGESIFLLSHFLVYFFLVIIFKIILIFFLFNNGQVAHSFSTSIFYNFIFLIFNF